MKFIFETQYTAETMASMAKALRKTIRKKQSRRSHIFGWIIFALGGLLVISNGFAFDSRTMITLITVIVLFIVLLFEDRINGYLAKKRLLAGTEKATAVFSETGFVSTTDIGTSEWKYDKIQIIAETTGFFVFIFSAKHAQLYDKHSLEGGTVDDFRSFIEAQTGKEIQIVN